MERKVVLFITILPSGDGFNRVVKNSATVRDPALCDSCKCSHIFKYAALSKTPRALADGLILVFHHPVDGSKVGTVLAQVK
jgi:hypothetical protein